MSGSDSEEVETHGNIFDDPEDFYPPTPPPTTQTYTTRTNKTITLHLVGFSPTEAHHLWNGSRVISDWYEDEIKGKTVLELGAGAGLPSIMAAVLGAKKVLVTDYPDVDIVETMWKNVDGCELVPHGIKPFNHDQNIITAKGFIWGADPRPLLAELQHLPPSSSSSSPVKDGEAAEAEQEPRFDVLILADLLFRHSEHGKLLDTIRDTLKKTSASAKAFVFFTSYRPWLQHKDLAFFDLARQRGFVVEKVLERVMERPMFEDDPGDEEIRKTCTGWVVRWPREGEVVRDVAGEVKKE
ncbi:hypothetical protein BD289DRAFT_378443 [Coniella lustricola]|uniref:Protein N-terminal and lysine N-methyltransferase EFM7 n=1 Tax=Coniella lustricola TaxID=2025994 RepID=A0A2T2ZU52_9PEZI|nr:hypothetical protein BD289DRAFT_378443 [Coniella lustricola]